MRRYDKVRSACDWQRPRLTSEFGNGTWRRMRFGLRTPGERFWGGRQRERSPLKISYLEYTQKTAAESGRPSMTRYATQRTTNRSTASFYPTESCVGCQHAAAFSLIARESPHGFWESALTSQRVNRRNSMRSAVAQSYLISVVWR